jgi:hypothetical protein
VGNQGEEGECTAKRDREGKSNGREGKGRRGEESGAEGGRWGWNELEGDGE